MKINEKLVRALAFKNMKIAAAESCTGGALASAIVDISGASSVLEYSAVTYSDRMKSVLLGVEEKLIAEKTAVSSEVAAKMAQGIRRISGADIGISTTGYAGPGGSDIGLVYIGISTRLGTRVFGFRFSGTRSEIRRSAVISALNIAYKAVRSI